MRKLFTFFSALFLGAALFAQTQVQFINNSADSLMYLSDVYMNGTMQKDNLAYKTATAFLSFAGDTTYTIAFRSEFDTTRLVSLSQTLQSGKKYVFVLNGVTNDSAFQKNPDSISNQLNIVVIDQSLLPVPSAGQVSLAVLNGSTDAPAFDLNTNDTLNTLLVNNDSLNQVQATVLADTILRLKLRSADGAFNISTFQFDLSALGGQTVTALSSGFFAPGSNKNGPNFSVYLVDSAGNVISTLNVSLVHNRNDLFTSLQLYPNPARAQIRLDYTLSQTSSLNYTIYSVSGELLQSNILPAFKGSNTEPIDLSALSPGIYFLQLRSEDSAKTLSFIIQ